MKYLVSLFILLALSIPTIASARVDVDTSGLNDADKAAIIQQVEALKSANAQRSVAPAAPAVDQLEKFVALGERSGKAVASFAKEMGVAGDKFLESNTGKIIAVLFIFNYGGDKVASAAIHIGVAFTFLFIMLPIWYWSYRRNILAAKPLLKDLQEFYKDKLDNIVFGHWFCFLIIWVIFFITLFNY